MLKIPLTVLALAAALASASPAAAAAAPASGGSFTSSEPLLNRIWSASVRTAMEMVVPGPIRTDVQGRACEIELKIVILDGRDRDRCPYIGDYAVVGKTLLLAGTTSAPALRDAIAWFASHQHQDGAIPASPFEHGTYVLFDYNAYWVETLYDYVLRTGDVALARQVWPSVVRLIDGWYRAHIGPQGLLVNDLGPRDYAYIARTGTTVAYYNAGYARALGMASQLAAWVGDTGHVNVWRGQVAPIAAAFSDAFWDPSVGAFRDATEGTVVHPQDGNAFAILAGLASRDQALAALDYLYGALWRGYGAAIADNDTWDEIPRWGDQASQRVYPFISYYELLARFSAGLDASAIDLIRREWGYMLWNGPTTTMWETIGPFGSRPVDWISPSWSHGWSSGAAPVLTEFVLGVTATSPGYATVAVQPHITGIYWARGDVPTPRGLIHVEWTRQGKGLAAKVHSPYPVTVTLPVAGRTVLNGRLIRAQVGQTTVKLGAGKHTLVVS